VRYRRVSGEFWLDSRVRALPHEDSRWQFLYILTCPSMTSVGAMRATVAGLAAELGWPLKRFRRALAPLVESGMVELNAEAAYIGLPKFLRHNPPESHNVVRGWVKALGLVPDCPEKRALVARCRDYLTAREVSGDLKQGFRQGFEQALAQAFGDAYADGSRLQSVIPEPETGGTTPETGDTSQEQEQEYVPPAPFNGVGRTKAATARRGQDAAWGRRAE